MTMRYRTVTVAALVIGVGVGTAGCGRYSLKALKAQKAYKEANDLYKASDWKGAATKYEYVLQQDPNRTEVYFYLGNSYDNAYKPARAGEAQNDLKAVFLTMPSTNGRNCGIRFERIVEIAVLTNVRLKRRAIKSLYDSSCQL